MSDDALGGARDALRRGQWQEAYDAATAQSTSDGFAAADRLDVLADACWWLGRLDDCIENREAAYRGFDEIGEHRRAAECAVWLYEHQAFKARPAIAGGWLRRARRSLADDTECFAYGALALREAEATHGRGELDEALAIASTIVELARRLQSADLEAESLQTIGRLLIDQGNPREGLAHLDEAMLFAIEGRLRPYSTGKVYCSLISACEELGDFARAAEWTEATSQWASDHPFAVFPGICRVHRASALTFRGALLDAEKEAEKACAELVSIHIPNASAAYAEMGDIRRRLGDLVGAEEAFSKAQELCGRNCSGLALVRLAQDRVALATRIIDNCLTDAGWNRLTRARLLSAHVQIAIAAEDLAGATASVDELEQTAKDFEAPTLAAAAALARGRLLLASGDKDAAAGALRDAVSLWQALEVPYEVASARTLLGAALRGIDDEASRVSFEVAAELFQQIGATLDAEHSRSSRTERVRAALPAGLTEREVEVLRLIAVGKTNKEIADVLFLSGKTVSRHLSNIFAKIGVSTRAAATAFAFENELTGPGR
ncbi:MAG: LuxR C-terminal-related transcriptional regulator [Gemmatimonadaceae bacterium]|nr:LuxR C-terminal-related transcriptional regulator [Gemmatimonadaceae bacterium]